MGVIDKIKNLHKQTLLKLKDIKRVVIADEAGVNNEEYLSRARTLDSYINPKVDEGEENELPEAEETKEQQESSMVSEITQQESSEVEQKLEDTTASSPTQPSSKTTASKKQKSIKL